MNQYLLEVTVVCTVSNTLPWMRLLGKRVKGGGQESRVAGAPTSRGQAGEETLPKKTKKGWAQECGAKGS